MKEPLVILWIGILGFTIIINFIISDFIFLGVSVGALIGIILSIFKISILLQIISFFIVMLLVTLMLYPKLKGALQKGGGEVKNIEDKFLGMEFILESDVNGEVLLFFKGTYWTFKNKGKPLKAGEKVKIVSIEGNKLIIDKVNPFRLEKL